MAANLRFSAAPLAQQAKLVSSKSTGWLEQRRGLLLSENAWEKLNAEDCFIENSILATCILFFEEGRNQVGESQGFLS